MKRVYAGSLAALIALCIAAPAFPLGLEMGWKAGLSITKLSGEITVSGEVPELGNEYSWRNGFTGGLFWDLRINEMISIQPEFIYMQKGAWIKDIPFEIYFDVQPILGSMDVEFRLWYFELPVLAKFTFLRDSWFSPFVFSGPVVSYTQRAIGEAAITFPGYFSTGERVDISSDLTKYDLGITFGGGFDIDFGSFSIFFEGRYSYGLWNVDNTGAGTELKNQAIAIMMGMSIPVTE